MFSPAFGFYRRAATLWIERGSLTCTRRLSSETPKSVGEMAWPGGPIAGCGRSQQTGFGSQRQYPGDHRKCSTLLPATCDSSWLFPHSRSACSPPRTDFMSIIWPSRVLKGRSVPTKAPRALSTTIGSGDPAVAGFLFFGATERFRYRPLLGWMKRHFSVLRVFLVGVGTAGGALWLLSLVLTVGHTHSISLDVPLNSYWSPVTLALFLVVEIVGMAVVIIVPGRDEQTNSIRLGTMGCLAAIVVFPPYLAVLTVGIASSLVQFSSRPLGRRRAWQFTVANIGSNILWTGAGAALFSAYGGRQLLMSPHLPGDAIRIILAVLGAAAVSYVVSYGFTVVSLWLIQRALARREGKTVSSRRIPTFATIREIFLTSHRNAILPESTAAIVGILFGYLWMVNPPLAPIALLPIAVIYLAFKNFIRLRELDRLKSNFITEVSHELRTPLSSILASTELLYRHADEMQPENVRDLSRSSYESTNHLFRVVENLLNASTIQSGTLAVHPVAVSMDEIIGDAVSQVQAFFESKNQSLDFDLPHDLPEVLADPRQVGQVLINLFTNASKYSADGTRILVECRPVGRAVRVAVIDEGIGIPGEDQGHVFERFYRVPSNSMTSVVGSGLGLTIVKSLVEMHNGEVGLSSNPGAGSTFWFTLPIAE